MSAALELDRARVVLGAREVLSDVSLTARTGEVLGVVGANGSGKTTLLRASLGLVGLAAGEARLGGRPIRRLSARERASLAGYLPQERRVAWNMPAWRIAALGAAHLSPALSHRRALAALEETGLAHLAERGVRDMSGGERARVLIARLLLTEAPLLAADEPTAGLDPAASMTIAAIFRRRADAGAAVLLTLHDLTLAARTCDRLAVLKAGRLIACASPAEALEPAVLTAAFGLNGELVDTAAGPALAALAIETQSAP